MPHPGDWQHWTASNRQLMEQWRKLLLADPGLPATPPTLPECFDALTAITDDVLALFETGKGCTWLSPNWERLTGRAVGASLQGGFMDALHADHAKPFTTALMQALTDDRAQLSLYPQQFLFVHANGTHRWFMLAVSEVKTLPGGAQQLVCGLKDVQETVEAQTRMKDARRETQLALQARSEFLNAMSHELRTPLNAILGFTQIMESGMYGDITNPQYQEYLRHIRESGYELLAQIDEVMEMATVDTGSTILRRDVCEAQELLQQVLAMHRAQAKLSNVTLHCEVPAGFARISADRSKLQHCISHIVANALRFSKPTGQINVRAARNDSGELCICVTDNGIGMSAKKLHSLVAALQQEDSWAARNTNGLGLGLALAKEYARLHEGYITLESKAGLGTRVTVHLPPECLVEGTEKVLRYSALAL